MAQQQQPKMHAFDDKSLFPFTLRESNNTSSDPLSLEKLSDEEKAQMIAACDETDVDFLLIHALGSEIFRKEHLSSMFAVHRAEVFKNPATQRIYSSKFKDVAVIAELAGAYKVAIPIASKNEEPEDVFISAPAQEDQESIEAQNLESYKRVQRNLALLNQEWVKNSYCSKFGQLLEKYFGDHQILIFRWGQKVPLRDIKRDLVNLLVKDKLSMEVALAKEFGIDDFFVTAMRSSREKGYQYSNFLRNDMVNVLITGEANSRLFCQNSFRICVYSTLQHTKKEFKWKLDKNAGSETCNLGSFSESFKTINEDVKKMETAVGSSKVRVEVYFKVENIHELNQGIASVKELAQQCTFCKVPAVEIVNLISLKRKTLLYLFNTFKEVSDSRAFFFFLYFHKYLAFIYSSARVTDNFLLKNQGMYLESKLLSKETKKPTAEILKSFTLKSVVRMLQSIFSSHSNSKGIVMYFFTQVFLQFSSEISVLPIVLTDCVNIYSSFIMEMSGIPQTLQGAQIQRVEINTIFLALRSKFSQRPFESQLFNLLSSYHPGEAFKKRLENVLCNSEFVLACHPHVYSLAEESNYFLGCIPWQMIKDFVQKYSFEEFIVFYCDLEPNKRPNSLYDANFAEKIFIQFQNELGKLKEHFFGTQTVNKAVDFVPEITVFFSFLFLAIPSHFQSPDGTMMRAIDLFSSFDFFFRFCYVGLLKYYCQNAAGYFSRKIKEFSYNVVACRHYKGEKRQKLESSVENPWTLNKLIYFSGRFDRSGCRNSGLFLPIEKKMLLDSRKGKSPFIQLRTSVPAEPHLRCMEFNYEFKLGRSRDSTADREVDISFFGTSSSDCGESSGEDDYLARQSARDAILTPESGSGASLTAESDRGTTLTAELTRDANLTVESDRGTTLTAELTKDANLTVERTSNANLTAQLNREALLITERARNSILLRESARDGPLAAAMIGDGSFNAQVTGDGDFNAGRTGNAPLTAPLTGDAQLNAEVNGNAQLTGTRTGDANLTAEVTGNALLTAQLIRDDFLTAERTEDAQLTGGSTGGSQLTAGRTGDSQLTTGGTGEAQLTGGSTGDANLAVHFTRDAPLTAGRTRDANLTAEVTEDANLTAEVSGNAELTAQLTRGAQLTSGRTGDANLTAGRTGDVSFSVPQRDEVLSLKEKLVLLFPCPEQLPMIDSMLDNGLEESFIIHESVENIANFLKFFCGISPIFCKGFAAAMKRSNQWR